MNIVLGQIKTFISQNEIVKVSIIDEVFGNRQHITRNGYNLYKDENMLCVIGNEIGYLCKWKGDYTIVIYKDDDKCKVCFYNKDIEVDTFNLENSDTSYFSILMDYHEVCSILEYNNLYNKKLRKFQF